jgi:hypothetical protein
VNPQDFRSSGPKFYVRPVSVNAETYAITKADLPLRSEVDEAENFGFGSTLSQDAW